MRVLIIALLAAISYAQTGQGSAITGAQPRGQQAIKLADATGAQIDDNAAVEATKNWLAEKKTQMKYLDNLKSQADQLTELVKKISNQRPQYASAVDRKNQADSALEEESVNYLAAELMRLKKKVDQTIQERDSIVDKYVPELKAAMKKRESQITKFWEGKQVDWKQEIETLHSQIAKLKEAQQAEIAEKEKELQAQRTEAAQKLQEANDDASKEMDKLRQEMTANNEANTKKMEEVNAEMKDRDEKWKTQLQEAHDKNTKQFKDNQAAIAAQNQKNEAAIATLTQKYEAEIKDVEAQLAKHREENKKKIEDLTTEKQNLQKQVIQADAKATKETALLKKEFSDQRQADRVANQKKEADLVKKLTAEKNLALKTQAEANKRALQNIQLQADQRLKNAEEARNNERERSKASQARMKEQIKVEQGRTDEANKKLREAQNRLDDLQTNMATLGANTQAQGAALENSALTSTNSGEEIMVASFATPTLAGINFKIVGALVGVNLLLSSVAIMYYLEGKKVNAYHAGLLEEF